MTFSRLIHLAHTFHLNIKAKTLVLLALCSSSRAVDTNLVHKERNSYPKNIQFYRFCPYPLGPDVATGHVYGNPYLQIQHKSVLSITIKSPVHTNKKSHFYIFQHGNLLNGQDPYTLNMS